MIKSDDGLYVQVDGDGRLELPAELISRYGMKPGNRVRVNAGPRGLNICSSPYSLAKLYIEPTSQCNLNCRTCIRNGWDEPLGNMSDAIFARIIEGLRSFSPLPTIFFGGFGEPLFHPGIVEMVAQAKVLGARVELITNGTLLSEDLSSALIRAGLDMLWVSLDGATPKSYADVRLGAALPQVLDNLARFAHLRDTVATVTDKSSETYGSFDHGSKIQLGIEFVAMKRNIADLPNVIDIGQRLGADRFIVSNVLPYNKEMLDEVLYSHTIYSSGYNRLSMPGMDINELTYAPIYGALQKIYGNWTTMGAENARDCCPFIKNGAGAISWDGNLSPCLPLLHNHTSYLGHLPRAERFSRRWILGNVEERNLLDMWNASEHLSFRERVQRFDFSPCTICGGSEFFADNEKDCYGNPFPTCGGCLWAQGIIQCP